MAYLDNGGLARLWAGLKAAFAPKTHNHTPAQVGLDKVNNTADKNKAVWSALALREYNTDWTEADTSFFAIRDADGCVNLGSTDSRPTRVDRASGDANGNPIMPKTGGQFTGQINTPSQNVSGFYVRTCVVTNNAQAHVSTHSIVMLRK